ncbi:MAG TPA: hypothetical protein VHG93_29130 [Longimicrobium sp.]|nr:hypothetical protein [Longimicrobium sp.]
MQLHAPAMPRFLDAAPAPPPRIRLRTSLLRAGLDAEPRKPILIHEEELPRGGVRVAQAFQRTRWRDGRAWLWMGVQKQTGRGEAPAAAPSTNSPTFPPPASTEGGRGFLLLPNSPEHSASGQVWRATRSRR